MVGRGAVSGPGALIGAVDIGGTSIAVGLVNQEGELVADLDMPTDAAGGCEPAMARIAQALRQMIAKTSPAGVLTGVGVGCTGPVDSKNGTVLDVDFLPGWQGCNLVSLLSRELGVEVALENDANAFALGEWTFGEGRHCRHFVCVTVGTGIGVSVINDGRLLRGIGDAHPEIGHHVIDPAGPRCFCGASGCWEVLARGPAIAHRYHQAILATGAPGAEYTAERVCALARSGDALARQEIEREAEYLALGVANLVTLFAPEVIVLAGSVMDSADLFLRPILERVCESCRLVPSENVRICTSHLGSRAALLGASVIWRQSRHT